MFKYLFTAVGMVVPLVLAQATPFPENEQILKAQMQALESSVYAPVIQAWKLRGTPLSDDEREQVWRMSVKVRWRESDPAPVLNPEPRIKILTDRERLAYSLSPGEDSADPAAPFQIDALDPRPAGMPTGSYALSSGANGYIYSSTEAMLKNVDPVAFHIEFEQVANDGRIMTQSLGLNAGDSSLGWDGRFEYQPDGKGGSEIVITQGAMELPVNLQEAAANACLAPKVSEDNYFRARHLFKLMSWQPAQNGQVARLVVQDRGVIFDFHPTTETRWIQADAKGHVVHAHGYGENFFPDPKDPRRPWLDQSGRAWRVFDMVTKEAVIETKNANGVFVKHSVPIETRAVAAPMDVKNPSKAEAGQDFIFVTSNRVPGTTKPLPAVVRYAFDVSGHVLEERNLMKDGSVVTDTEGLIDNAPALLNEGLNFFEREVKLGTRSVYLATNSAGEYTSGGLPRANPNFYGTYLWFRDVSAGRIGAFTPVMNASGTDLKDMFRDITQMYGASWGIGRAQLLQNGNQIWAKAHMVDVDLLPPDRVRFPQSGYPASADDFENAYHRHQIILPITVDEENSQPVLKVSDPEVLQDLALWRARMLARNIHIAE